MTGRRPVYRNNRNRPKQVVATNAAILVLYVVTLLFGLLASDTGAFVGKLKSGVSTTTGALLGALLGAFDGNFVGEAVAPTSVGTCDGVSDGNSLG